MEPIPATLSGDKHAVTFYRAEYREHRRWSEWFLTRKEAEEYLHEHAPGRHEFLQWQVTNLTLQVPVEWDNQKVLEMVNSSKLQG